MKSDNRILKHATIRIQHPQATNAYIELRLVGRGATEQRCNDDIREQARNYRDSMQIIWVGVK